MNPAIGDIARKYKAAKTGHERSGAVDELRELADGKDIAQFLLEEIAGGLRGHIRVRQHPTRGYGVMTPQSTQITIDGLDGLFIQRFAFVCDCNEDVVKVQLELAPSELDVDMNVLLMLMLLANNIPPHTENRACACVRDDARDCFAVRHGTSAHTPAVFKDGNVCECSCHTASKENNDIL